MTARELYEYALIELNKLEAPSLLLEDYNYFINKAIQQYINLVYAKQEIDQQSTDDIRVLKATTIQVPQKLTGALDGQSIADLVSGSLHNATYFTNLPADYMHLLNCVVEYEVNTSNFKCYNQGDKVYFAARRLTSDMFTQILNNAYMQPSYKRPYYFINNLNTPVPVSGDDSTKTSLPTNTDNDEAILDWISTNMSTDSEFLQLKSEYLTAYGAYTTALKNYISNPDLPANVTALNTTKATLQTAREAFLEKGSLVDSQTDPGDRLSNPSPVRLEIRFGADDRVFKPTHLYIDYIKSPMYIRLTQDQINSTLDYSQVLEFPDYVCFEIANIFTRLIMENASDPRLQTNMPINNTIPLPQQTQASNK